MNRQKQAMQLVDKLREKYGKRWALYAMRNGKEWRALCHLSGVRVQ